MSDGDIFKFQNGLFLQLGEIERSLEAPLARIYINDSDQIRDCHPKFQKYFIPSWNFPIALGYHVYISMVRKSIKLEQLSRIAQMQYMGTLSYPYMNIINNCALTRGAVDLTIRPYLRTNRPS